MNDTPPFDMIDALLAGHPFGNSDYVQERLHVCYERRLNKISTRLPAAGRLLDALRGADAYMRYRTIGDTVVRCAVQHAMTQIETGARHGLPLDQCEDVFRATIRLVERGEHGPLGSGLVDRLGPDRHHGWIWSEKRADDVIARAFRCVVQLNYGDPLSTPSSDEVAMLTRGARLLSELLPSSSQSALAHAHLIAVFSPVGAWGRKASSSQFRVSGTIFLNRTLLSNPWWVAEHLFHEVLHQQMYDFRHGHTLLEPGFGREEAPRVCSLWNLPDARKTNYWDTHRTLAAFHVYVHLALLGGVADQRAPALEAAYGPLEGPIAMTGSRKAANRARYLAEQLRSACWQELGPAGRRFVDWFSSVLDAIDPCPPPQGAYAHLLLDRYQRETKEVERFVRKTDRHPDLFRQRLTMLARDEARSARHALAAANAGVALARLDEALAHFSDEDLGTQFTRVRDIISRAILDASPDGYGWTSHLPEPAAPDAILKQMVESSSESLSVLLGS